MSDALTGMENLRFALDLMAVSWNEARVLFCRPCL
jgi:heme exporter protein A